MPATVPLSELAIENASLLDLQKRILRLERDNAAMKNELSTVRERVQLLGRRMLNLERQLADETRPTVAFHAPAVPRGD